MGLKEVGAMAECSLRTEEPWRQRGGIKKQRKEANRARMRSHLVSDL